MTDHSFHFKATGIGSVPWTDVQGTCANILTLFPDIPFWPQFVQRSYVEDMIIQYSEGLPSLKILEEKKGIRTRHFLRPLFKG